MKNYFLSFVAIAIVFLGCKTGIESPKIFFGPKENEQNLLNITTSTPVTVSAAQAMIKSYSLSPLSQLQTADVGGAGKLVPIKAFEIEPQVLDTFRKYPNMVGMRIYLGKRPDSTYTLIIVPKDINNNNILQDNWIFDWNNPCPPYCPGAAQTLGQ